MQQYSDGTGSMSGQTELLMMNMPPGTFVMSVNSTQQALGHSPENIPHQHHSLKQPQHHKQLQMSEPSQSMQGMKKKQITLGGTLRQQKADATAMLNKKLEPDQQKQFKVIHKHHAPPQSVMLQQSQHLASQTNSRGSSVSRPGTGVMRTTASNS